MHELRKISYYERLLTLDMPASAHFIYNHAGTMNQRGGGDTMYTSFNAYNSEVVADDVVVVGDSATSKYVLVGALTANRSLTHLSVVWRGRKMREIKIWQPEIKEGEEPEGPLPDPPGVLPGPPFVKAHEAQGRKVDPRQGPEADAKGRHGQST